MCCSGHLARNKLMVLSAQSSARENFFQKNTLTREALVINTFRLLSAPFYSNIYKSSAQNPFRAEDFCSIIIEAQILETQKPQKAHRSPIDVLSWSRNLQHAYSHPNKEGVVILKCEKIHFFQKNHYFLINYLVNSNKSSTFAPTNLPRFP